VIPLEKPTMRVVLFRARRLLAAASFVAMTSAVSGAQAPPAAAPAQPAPQPAGPVLTLTVDEAVRLGLENNLDLQVQRLDPQVQDENVRQAKTAWAPSLVGSFSYNNADQPPDSLFSGAADVLKTDISSGSVGLQQVLPWGANYSATWDALRSESNNQFTNFNPRLRSGLALSFAQPLLKDRAVDSARTQLVVSQRNREISDVQLRATVVNTIRDVKTAYWELAVAIANLASQRQSLELAQQTLKDNRTRVQVGTMAPIDIVEAEAEVARNEEAVIIAEAAIKQTEDRLRSLIFDPKTPAFWETTLQPTGYEADLQALQPVDGEAAAQAALEKRTDLQRAMKELNNVEANLKYYRNQTLPQLNLQADLSGAGLGGTQLLFGDGFPPPVIGTAEAPFSDVLGDVFSFNYPTWAIGVTVSYPLGTSAAETSVARTRLQLQQQRLQIQNLELQIGTQVREAARSVNTNIKRIDATRASRVLSERRLEAEQKKFGVGMSTSFLVFQAQRDLTTARNNELRALIDYAKSKVDFEALQEAAIGGGGVTIGSTGTALATTAGTQAATALQRQQ